MAVTQNHRHLKTTVTHSTRRSKMAVTKLIVAQNTPYRMRTLSKITVTENSRDPKTTVTHNTRHSKMGVTKLIVAPKLLLLKIPDNEYECYSK